MIPGVIVPFGKNEILAAVKARTTVAQFENSLSNYFNERHTMATGSGTMALHIILKAYSLGKGVEIAMPGYMCETVGRLLLDMGYKIKFIDVEPLSHNISPDDLRKKISQDTKALIAVHMYGNPCNMKEINEICKDNDTKIIEDAAQALGVQASSGKSGQLSDVSFFSFGLGKPMTTIHGGAITTDDKTFFDACKKVNDNLGCGKMRQEFKFQTLIAYSN